ncbi:hypothetical protein D3C73_1369580 [compost metagenome]
MMANDKYTCRLYFHANRLTSRNNLKVQVSPLHLLVQLLIKRCSIALKRSRYA